MLTGSPHQLWIWPWKEQLCIWTLESSSSQTVCQASKKTRGKWRSSVMEAPWRVTAVRGGREEEEQEERFPIGVLIVVKC